jgi:histidine ammonia-lyase
MRLDGYSETAPELFQQVVDRIANDVLPVVRQSGLAGARARPAAAAGGGAGQATGFQQQQRRRGGAGRR